jgi:hypothetical protein
MINKLCLLVFSLPLLALSQTLTGRVIDKVTQDPIETVSVYFDNTTIGTTTDENGDFVITYSDAVQSTLVISFLGYEKVLIGDYRNRDTIFVELEEASNLLDEVYLEYDDGLSRRQKLRLFRKEFLGRSSFGKSCKILNENDLTLRYNQRDQALYASSRVPLKVKNKALQYEVSYDIIDFEVQYRIVNLETQNFVPNSVSYQGTAFFKDLEKSKKKKVIKNRERAYRGSVQHFMRSIYNKNLKEEGYSIFFGGFAVDEWAYFSVENLDDSVFKKVSLKDRVNILFDKEAQSEIKLSVEEFFVDAYGNYAPILGVYFIGAMGVQRLGDTLPSDYGIVKK